MDQDVYNQIHLYTSSESESDGDCKDEFDDLFYKYQPKPIDQETLLRNLVTVQAENSSDQGVEEEFGIQGSLILNNLLESLDLDLEVSTFKELLQHIHWIEFMILRRNRVDLYDSLKQLRFEVGIFENNSWFYIKKSPKDLKDVDFTYLRKLLKSIEDSTGLRVDITRNDSKINILLKILNLEEVLWSKSLTFSRNSRLTVYSDLSNIKNMVGYTEMNLLDSDDALSAKEEELFESLSNIIKNIPCSNYSISELEICRIYEELRLTYFYAIDNNLSQKSLMLILKFAKYMQKLMKEKYSIGLGLEWTFQYNHKRGGKYLFLCEGLENINKELINCSIISEDVKNTLIGDLEVLYDTVLGIPDIQEKYYILNTLLEIYTKIYGPDKFIPVNVTPTVQQYSNQRNEHVNQSYSMALKNKAPNTVTKTQVIDCKTAIQKFKREAKKIQKNAHLKSKLRIITLEYYNWLSLDVETKNEIQVLLEELKLNIDIDINVFTNDYEQFKTKLKQIRGNIEGKKIGIFYKIMNLIYKSGRYNFIQQLLSEYQLKYFMYFFLSDNEINQINQQLEELNSVLDLKVQIYKGNYEVFVNNMTTMKSKLQILDNSGYLKKFNDIEKVLETNPKPTYKKTPKKCKSSNLTIGTSISSNIYPKFNDLTKGQKKNIKSMLKPINKTFSMDINPKSDYATFVLKMTTMKEKVRKMANSQQRDEFLNRIKNIETILNVKPKEVTVKETPVSAKEVSSGDVYPNFKHLTQGQKENLRNMIREINKSTGVFVDFYFDLTTLVTQMKKMKDTVRNMANSQERNKFLKRIKNIETILNVKPKVAVVKETPVSAKEVSSADVYPNFKHLTQGQKENLQNMMKKINTSTGVFVDFYVDSNNFVSQMKQMKEKVRNMKKSEEKNNFLEKIKYVESHLIVKPANPLNDVYPKFKVLTVEQKEWFQNVLDSVNAITGVDVNLNSEYSTFVRNMKSMKEHVCRMENLEEKSVVLDKIQFVEQYLVDKKLIKTSLTLKPKVPDNSENERSYFKFNNLTAGQKQCLQNMLKKVIELTGIDINLNSDYTNFSCKLKAVEDIVRGIPQHSKRNDMLKKIEYVQQYLTFDPVELYPNLTNLTKEQREHLQNVLNEVNVVTATNIDINTKQQTFVHQISMAKDILRRMKNLDNSDSLLNKIRYVEDYLNDKLTTLDDNKTTPLSHLTPEDTASKKSVYPKFYTLTIGQKQFLQGLLKKVNVMTGLCVDPYADYYKFLNQMSMLKNMVQEIINLDEKKVLLKRIEQVENYLNETPIISSDEHSSNESIYPNFKNLTIEQKETTNKLLKHIKEITGIDVNLDSDYTTFISQMKTMKDTVSEMRPSLQKNNALDIIDELEAILNHNSKLQEYPNFKYLTVDQKENLQKMLKRVIDTVDVDVDVKSDYETFVNNMNKLKQKLRKIKNLNERVSLRNRIECVENFLTIPSEKSGNENMALTNISNSNQKETKVQAIEVMTKLETSPSIPSSNNDEENNLPSIDLDKNVAVFDFSTYMSEDSYQKYKSLTEIEKNIINRLLKDLPLNNVDVKTDDYFSFTNKMEALKNTINQMPKSKKKHMCLENIFKIETVLFKENQDIETNKPKISIIKNIDEIYPQYNLLNVNQRTHVSTMLSKINSTCNIKLDPMLDTASEFYNKLEGVKQKISTRKKDLKKDFQQRILYIEALLGYNTAVVPSYVEVEETVKSPTTLNRKQKIQLINIDCPEAGDKIVKKEYSQYRNLDQKQILHINNILANINNMFNMNINAEVDDSCVFYQKLQKVKTLLQNNTVKEKRRITEMQINIIEEFVGSPIVAIQSSNGLNNLLNNIDQKHRNLDQNIEKPEKTITPEVKLEKIKKKDSTIIGKSAWPYLPNLKKVLDSTPTPNTMKSVKTERIMSVSVSKPSLEHMNTSPKTQYVRKYDSLTPGDKIHINNLLKKLNLITKTDADVNVDNLNIFTSKLGTIKSKILGIDKWRLRKSYLKHVSLIEEFLGIELTEIEPIKNTMVYVESFRNYSMRNRWYCSKLEHVHPIVPNNSSKSKQTKQYLLAPQAKKKINQLLEGLSAKTKVKIDVNVDDHETFVEKLNSMKNTVKNMKKKKEKYLNNISEIEKCLKLDDETINREVLTSDRKKFICDSCESYKTCIDCNGDDEELSYSNDPLSDLEYLYTVYKICDARDKRKINSLMRNFNSNTQRCLELYLDGRPLVKLSRSRTYHKPYSQIEKKQRDFINKFNYQQKQINNITKNDLCGKSNTAQEFIKKLEYSTAIINTIYPSKKSKMPWKLMVNELKKNIMQYKRYLESCNVQTVVTPDTTVIYKDISTLDNVEFNEVNNLLLNLNETIGLDLQMSDFQDKISQLKNRILQMNVKVIQLDCAKAVYSIEQILGCKKFEGPIYELLKSENIQPMGRKEHLRQIQEELEGLQNTVEWSENMENELDKKICSRVDRLLIFREELKRRQNTIQDIVSNGDVKTENCTNYTSLNPEEKIKFNNLVENINRLTGNNLSIESDISEEFVRKLVKTKATAQSSPNLTKTEILANIKKIEQYLKFEEDFYPKYKSLLPNQIKYINRKLRDLNTLCNINIHANMDYYIFVYNMQKAKNHVWQSQTLSMDLKLKYINRLKEVEVQLGRNEILTFSTNMNGNDMEFVIRIKNLNFVLGENSNLSVEMSSQLFLSTCDDIRKIINDRFSNKEDIFNKLDSLIKLRKYANADSLGTFEMITWGKFHHLTKMLLRNNDVSVNEWLWKGFNIFENIILEKIEEFQEFLMREGCDNAVTGRIVLIREQLSVLWDVHQCIVDFRALKNL